MTNKLYFIAHEDPDGENKDLMVVAGSPFYAFRFWVDYYHGGDTSEASWLTGKVEEKGFPKSSIQLAQCLRIYEVAHDLAKPGALEWFKRVNIRGIVRPS